MKLIVPVLNRYDLLQRMVQSIDYPIDELLIIDNGDKLTALEVPRLVGNLRILRMPSNLGVAASWNLGIKLYPEEKVWFFSSADMVYGAGALERLSEANWDEITLCRQFPHWQSFGIGEWVVRKIGLFDENYYPIYYEDTDYIYRAVGEAITIRRLDIPTQHDNSSTINSDPTLAEANRQTFSANGSYFDAKVERNDRSAGRYDLDRRRKHQWPQS